MQRSVNSPPVTRSSNLSTACFTHCPRNWNGLQPSLESREYALLPYSPVYICGHSLNIPHNPVYNQCCTDCGRLYGASTQNKDCFYEHYGRRWGLAMCGENVISKNHPFPLHTTPCLFPVYSHCEISNAWAFVTVYRAITQNNNKLVPHTEMTCTVLQTFVSVVSFLFFFFRLMRLYHINTFFN